MKLALISDLHLEYYTRWKSVLPDVSDDVDVLVLAGDIAPGNRAIQALHILLDRYPAADIIWVAGNHEYHGAPCLESQREVFAEACVAHPRLHFLDDTAVTLKEFRWLGTTLWTGFDVLGEEWTAQAMDAARHELGDFERIGRGEHRFDPESAARLYATARNWLTEELATTDPNRTIVVTHFPPCLEVVHPDFPEDIFTPSFVANCKGLIETYQPRLWLYGHNHWTQEVMIGKTRILSNQYGYPWENNCPPAFQLLEVEGL